MVALEVETGYRVAVPVPGTILVLSAWNWLSCELVVNFERIRDDELSTDCVGLLVSLDGEDVEVLGSTPRPLKI